MEGPVKLLDCPPKVGQSKSEGRVRYLDSFRGFAIILVVMEHLIQSNYASGIHNHIFNVIYGFHMPMFFFISGFSRSLEESRKGMISTAGNLMRYIWSKFLTILLPSVSWTLIVPLFFSDELTWDARISSFLFLNVLFAVSAIWGIFSFVDIGFLSRTEVCLGVWLQVIVLSALAILIALCCIGIQKVFSIFPYLGGILYGKWKGGGR